MSVAISNKTSGISLGASLFVPSSTARDLYEAVLDVRSFPRWAPGVRRVEIVEGLPGPGMVSEWEVSVLGFKRRVWSVLEEAESPDFLRWTYDGLVHGWGECAIRDRGDGVLAEFRTELNPAEPILEKLMRAPAARSAATRHLKRCLVRLGETVSGNGRQARVGPLESFQQSAVSRQLLPG